MVFTVQICPFLLNLFLIIFCFDGIVNDIVFSP